MAYYKTGLTSLWKMCSLHLLLFYIHTPGRISPTVGILVMELTLRHALLFPRKTIILKFYERITIRGTALPRVNDVLLSKQ